MGKTLRKFSNKEKKTKRKRSYKTGGAADAWVDLRETIEEQLKKYEQKVEGRKKDWNWAAGILKQLYVEINKTKRSCREISYFLKQDIKNEQCEAFKYLEYDLLQRYMIKQYNKLNKLNSPDAEQKNTLVHWIERIRGLATSKMTHNRSKEQTINYLNSLTKDNIDYFSNHTYRENMINIYFEFLSENLHNRSITNNIIKENIMDKVNEQAKQKRKEKEEEDKDKARLKKVAEQKQLNKENQEKSIEQLKKEGYNKLEEINTDGFETNKDTYTYKMVDESGKIFDLGRFKELKKRGYYEVQQDMDTLSSLRERGINDHVFEKNPPRASSMYAIFYKTIDESTGGKKKYKKNRKTARRGRK